MLAAADRFANIRAALPAQGLFAEREWRISPVPFPLSARQVDELEKLGHRLLLFYRAANLLYHQSAKGKQPAWVADYLDRGKPEHLIALARDKRFRDDLPQVLRPDLILTEHGFAISELDSVPGGIGLTAWLHETYSQFGHDLVGGASGMLDGFASILPEGADILVSQEAATYRPEMDWVAERLNARGGAHYHVCDAEGWSPSAAKSIYRFFELFDLPNIPSVASILSELEAGNIRVTAPFKAFLEEKLWLALFWAKPLQAFWRRELHERHWLKLQEMIPYSWIVDPAPLPHHAVLPRLEIQSWEELGAFSQKERELVLKISGFSETAWGSRGVTIGQDVSHHDWKDALRVAVESFPHHPYVLQEFQHARVIEHPWYNPATGTMEMMRGRARLCPYYFVAEGKAKLGGVLCTIVPADKKIIHGMRDAILVPVEVAAE